MASVQAIGLLLLGHEICAAVPVVERKEEPAVAPAPEPEPQPAVSAERQNSGNTKSQKSPLWKTIWDKVNEEMDKEN